MLAELLPRWARVVETTTDGPAGLFAFAFAEEEALVARATAGRRREFGTGRRCAREALAALGVPPAPLLRGRRGMPAWPAGVVGSITHCAGYRAAAVADGRDALGLGIDAEPDAALPEGVLAAVAFGPEPAQLAAYRRLRPELAWDRLLFSAKEAVYKAWSGAGGGWLGFEEAVVGIDPPGRSQTGTFHAVLPAGGAIGPLLQGRWAAAGGLLVTAVAVERAAVDRVAVERPEESRR
ncbi:4'-phosphopantetheinyl transferase family protein [Kitasatospora sp. McL0602]|uniref:4'-phosphopantetheinyl transferase family protein n=1 Tax=Kitasatospora sp. McL0602 TaxID=3439530 RepID=UPI003F8CDF0E